MRANQLLEARKKKVVEPAIPYNPGWETLNWFKERAKKRGDQLVGSLQLFMPRPSQHSKTSYDRRKDNLANKYTHDDEGNIKPDSEKWEKGSYGLNEAPMLLPGKSSAMPGGNKPIAKLWTSTAKQLPDGTWTSDWVRWVSGNQSDWMAETGSLYNVKPGALILELNSDHDARQLLNAFRDLGRYTALKSDAQDYYNGWDMHRAYPWQEVVKHFDAVTHSGHRWDGEFMYGWDCESTAWMDASFLKLVGEIKIRSTSPDDDDY